MKRKKRNQVIGLMLTVVLTLQLQAGAAALPVQAANAADANQQQVFRFLTDEMKLNSAAACGIMANIERESGFNPKASGSGGRFYGLIQWGGSRQTALYTYCGQNGYDPNSIAGQLRYMEYELNTDYTNVRDALRTVANTADGAYQAGYVWCYYYEMPGDTYNVSVARGNLARDSYWPEFGRQVLPFRSNIESPANQQSYSGIVRIQGWAVYGDGIGTVTAKVNGHVLELQQYSRQDVAAAYPGYPAGREGFFADIPADCLQIGTNELIIYAGSGQLQFEAGRVQFSCAELDTAAPVISDVAVSNVTEDGYQVTCTVTDDFGLREVRFPTWTEYNGQDDLQKNWSVAESAKGTVTGNQVVYQVRVQDHDYESGLYYTHIYAYDRAGHQSVAVLSCTVPDSPLLYGDANGDRSVAVDDAIRVLQVLIRLRGMNERQTLAADVDGVPGIEVADALCILKKTVNLIQEFPVERQVNEQQPVA